MNDDPLSELERRLAARAAPAVSDAIRARMLSNLRRERRRELLVPVSALLAVCAAGWILSLPNSSFGSPVFVAPALDAWPEFAGLELDEDALRVSQSFLAQARVPRIAPPLGSDPRFSFLSEAR
jgi:hypothetical protein